MEQKIFSPLRYPGAKSNLVDYISCLVSREYTDLNYTIIEPYAGSSIISLSLIYNQQAKNAIIVERDPLIFAFWSIVFSNPDELISRVNSLEVSINTWHKFQKYRKAITPDDFPLIDMAVAGFFFNRTNFSGILKANPIGGLQQKSKYKIDCRFNKKRLIEQIELIATLQDKIEVHFDDALDFMKKNQFQFKAFPCLLYIDPPYFAMGKSLYRYWYEMDDHVQLANFLLNLKDSVRWLVSYDCHPEVEALYNKNIKQQIHFDYSVRTRKSELELLISNMEIPPWEIAIPNIR